MKNIGMKNIDKLFTANEEISFNPYCDKRQVIFKCNDKTFSGKTIRDILQFIYSVHKKYKTLNIPIVFFLGVTDIADKLSFILFECICYQLILQYHHPITIYWDPKPDIWTHGITESPLNYIMIKDFGNLLRKNKNQFFINKNINNLPYKNGNLTFVNKFEKEILFHHFRRIIHCNDLESNFIGKLVQEMDSFFKFLSIKKDYRDQITEVIGELVGNACEHGLSDCLLDINVSEDYQKKVCNVCQDGFFNGINISIVNFSDILLGDGIKRKINEDNLHTSRYKDLKRAYNYHKDYFTDEYTCDDFYNISALQDKISGRPEHDLAGGTGLTKLIHSLQEKSDSDECYVLSGNKSVYFMKDVLEYDANGWLGFNTKRKFLDGVPDANICSEGYIFFPGTAYNLNFIMKQEDFRDDNN